MSKLTTLYYGYLKELNEELKDYLIKSDTVQALLDYLHETLNEEQYLEAESMLSNIINEVEEAGFKEGCKYYYGLTQDLGRRETQ